MKSQTRFVPPLTTTLRAMPRLFVSTGCLIAVLSLAARGDDASTVEFNRDIRPILSDKCFACHGPDAKHREADLRFDTQEGAQVDLGGYRAIVPGQPKESALIERVTSADESLRMPPVDTGKTLSDDEVELLRRWIQQGAKFQSHWSLIPATRPEVPEVENREWPVNDVDRFILRRLESAGLQPSADADRITLARRLYFDLTGLPPTPEQIDRFVDSTSARAYEELVDQLLASRHYGERMAMYWLDLVRYADSVGYHGDQEHAITPYRDYVIKAFNDNMPFDQFTVEQLAGDLLPNATVDQKIASGYNRVLQTSHEGGVQVQEYLKKYDADRVRNVSVVWMGATMGCAECHDHKFDPYTQKDFYSLAAFFADVDDMKTFRGSNTSPTKRDPEMVVLSPIDRQRIASLRQQLQAIQDDGVDDSADDSADDGADDGADEAKRIEALRDEIELLEAQTRRTMVTVATEPRTIRILNRGDWMDESGEIVEPAVPEALPPLDIEGRRATRLDLARWLTSPNHPQTSRVFVNRLWYLYFGNGLSGTLDDAGSQGSWPTHPALLDYLAVEFVESGWDIKHLVKLLVMSRTYRQSSLASPQLRAADPGNRLYARQSRWRLPAEMIRDNALTVSGLLIDQIGGPSAKPYQPTGYYAHLNFPRRVYTAHMDENQYRRGVYVHWQRMFLHPMLRAFDAPSREECTAQRSISNTPLAALTLMNDPTFVEAARVLAANILSHGGTTDTSRITWAWRRVLSRHPSDAEVAVVAKLLQQNRETYRSNPAGADALLNVGLAENPDHLDKPELAAWAAVARAILNLNETITRN